MYSANATMRAKFRIHFRYTRQRNTTFTQLYHPAQKLEQRQKRLARALNTVHIHRIQVFISTAAFIFVRIFAPNSSAYCKSFASGRPGAIGFCSVLYECSPTKVAPAITLKPWAEANASNSIKAFSYARLP